MAFEPTAYTIVYASAALIGVVAAVVAWRRRSAPGAVDLMFMMLAAVVWCGFDALESAAVGIPAHVVWAQAAYLGNMPIAVFLLLFALDYTGRGRPTPWKVAALFVVPVIGLIGAATNQLHHFLWTGFAAVPGRMNLVLYAHGWLAWVVTLYALGVALAAGALLIGFAFRTKAPYRRQSLAVVAAILVPWVAEVIYVTNSHFLPGVDPSVTMTLSGALMAVGLVRFRLLDLIPVARERLVECMEDGLLVLDTEGRILDSNPATGRITGSARVGWEGTNVGSALAGWPALGELLGRADLSDGETTLLSPTGKSISVTIIPLQPVHGLRGTLVTLRDATVQARTEAALQSMNADLHHRVEQIEHLQEELREQALRDSLTGLFNRRYLDATLTREIGRARREGYPVSVVMIDVDHFKRINDENGHPVGDQVLRFLGAQLNAGLRTGDIACRYGGDEFLLVLPNTKVENARARAEDWRAAVRESSVSWTDRAEPTTLSLGVAGFPQNGDSAEAIMVASDAALYEAKSTGRNRVVVSIALEPEEPEGSLD